MANEHLIVSLTAGQFIDPHVFGSPVEVEKMATQRFPYGGVCDALLYLMQAPATRGEGDFGKIPPILGLWHGHRLLLVGEYAEMSDTETGVDQEGVPLPHAHELRKRCFSAGTKPDDGDMGYVVRDVSVPVAMALAKVRGIWYLDSPTSPGRVVRASRSGITEKTFEKYPEPGYYATPLSRMFS